MHGRKGRETHRCRRSSRRPGRRRSPTRPSIKRPFVALCHSLVGVLSLSVRERMVNSASLSNVRWNPVDRSYVCDVAPRPD